MGKIKLVFTNELLFRKDDLVLSELVRFISTWTAKFRNWWFNITFQGKQLNSKYLEMTEKWRKRTIWREPTADKIDITSIKFLWEWAYCETVISLTILEYPQFKILLFNFHTFEITKLNIRMEYTWKIVEIVTEINFNTQG